MNDENSVFENAEETPCSACHSFETEDASKKASSPTVEEEALPGTDEAVVSISADTGTNSDPGRESADLEAQKSELEQLRGELAQLREELAMRDARIRQEERITREYAEFCDLYPQIAVSTLPQEIWRDVEGGTPLAAAYALAERKKAVSVAKANESNATNRARSAGAVKNAESIEFSPSEVRAMSSAEVRANLPKIMRSMQKWH